MKEFNITYEDLFKAHKEKVFQLDRAYNELILPTINKDPWTNLDDIIDFVRRWNKRVPIGRNKDKIKGVILNLKKDFESISNYNLEDIDFDDKNIETIRRIFDTLSEKVLKFTGATKLMHGINPNLFVMWDKGIYQHYGCYPNSIGYIHFMRSMQEITLNILKQHNKDDILKETGRTLPKLIDEYNWMNFRTSKVF